MADPFSLSTQYQDRLDSSTKYLDEVPRFVMEGMKIPGVIAQNRILKNQAAESDQQLSINEQVGAMIKNPVGFIHEFGQLKTAAEMRQFMSKYAVIAASPQGKNIMAQFDKAATLTEDAEQHSISRQVQMVDAKYKAELVLKYPGVDFEMAKRQDNELKTLEQFAVLASKSGNSLTEIKDEWINPDGTANLRLALPGIAGLPRSERLQSNEGIATDRIAEREKAAADSRALRVELATMSQEGKQALQDQRISARKALAAGEVSREKYVARETATIMKSLESDRQARKLSPEEKMARASAIAGKAWDDEIGSRRTAPVAPASNPEMGKSEMGADGFITTDSPPAKTQAPPAPAQRIRKFNPMTGQLE